MFEPLPELTQEERDALIERIATGVVKRGLAAPAILFLEMHKPLAFIAGQGLLAMSGFVAPFLGIDRTRRASVLMQDRRNVERIIARIEELEAEARATERGANDAAR